MSNVTAIPLPDDAPNRRTSQASAAAALGPAEAAVADALSGSYDEDSTRLPTASRLARETEARAAAVILEANAALQRGVADLSSATEKATAAKATADAAEGVVSERAQAVLAAVTGIEESPEPHRVNETRHGVRAIAAGAGMAVLASAELPLAQRVYEVFKADSNAIWAIAVGFSWANLLAAHRFGAAMKEVTLYGGNRRRVAAWGVIMTVLLIGMAATAWAFGALRGVLFVADAQRLVKNTPGLATLDVGRATLMFVAAQLLFNAVAFAIGYVQHSEPVERLKQARSRLWWAARRHRRALAGLLKMTVKRATCEAALHAVEDRVHDRVDHVLADGTASIARYHEVLVRSVAHPTTADQLAGIDVPTPEAPAWPKRARHHAKPSGQPGPAA